MNIADIYYYVFGNRAVVVADQRLSGQHAVDSVEMKRKKIKEEFESLWVVNKNLRAKFNTLLTALSVKNKSAQALENILFLDDINKNKNEIEKIEFPDDKSIKSKFHHLNERYKLIPKTELDQSEADFLKLFCACKLTADYIEKNNDVDDNTAYLHAYKLLVLFGLNKDSTKGKSGNLFKYILDYLKQHGKGEKPLHDALIIDLPVCELPLKDMRGWRQLINKYGINAIEYFQIAPQIEKLSDGKAPKNLVEACEIASKLIYKRANEYPELALLCNQYHLPEDVFNKCLEIEKTRKKTDELPNIVISGNELGYPGYYLLKLPIDDPRAYILGHITGCCQSIGWASEQCVIDGLTKRKNAFYVMLKQKGKVASKPIENGKINYADFQIVGQGYTWLSASGNLTIDSWENLRPDVDDSVAVDMLGDFGKAVTNLNNDILRVTIGVGGKTPRYFAHAELKVEHPEEIAEGCQYGDSLRQGLIHINKKKITEVTGDFLNKHFGKYAVICKHDKNEFMELFPLHKIVSKLQLDLLDTLFFDDQTIPVWNEFFSQDNSSIEAFKRVTRENDSLSPFINIIILLNENKLINVENVSSVLDRDGALLTTIASLLENLFKHGILNESNLKILLNRNREKGYFDELAGCANRLINFNIFADVFNDIIKFDEITLSPLSQALDAFWDGRHGYSLTKNDFMFFITLPPDSLKNLANALRFCPIELNEKNKDIIYQATHFYMNNCRFEPIPMYQLVRTINILDKANIVLNEESAQILKSTKLSIDFPENIDKLVKSELFMFADDLFKLTLSKAHLCGEFVNTLIAFHRNQLDTPENISLLLSMCKEESHFRTIRNLLVILQNNGIKIEISDMRGYVSARNWPFLDSTYYRLLEIIDYCHFSRENVELLMKQKSLLGMNYLFYHLSSSKSGPECNTLRQHLNPYTINILIKFQHCFLDKNNFNETTIILINRLYKKNILTNVKNLELLSKVTMKLDDKPSENLFVVLANLLCTISEHKLLNDDARTLIDKQSGNLFNLSKTVKMLADANFLDAQAIKLLNSTHHDLEKMAELIIDLRKYQTGLLLDLEINHGREFITFFITSASATDELNAVNQLFKILGNESESFTTKELEALTQGRLGRLIQKYMGMIPDSLINQKINVTNTK